MLVFNSGFISAVVRGVCNHLFCGLAGYTLYDHKTNDYIRRELRLICIQLDSNSLTKTKN